jgi:hypothetical protein
MSTASPGSASRRTTARCSSLSEGRAAVAASTAAGSATAVPLACPTIAVSTVRCSSSRISGVVQMRPSTSSTAWAEARNSATLSSICSSVAPWVAPVATLRTMSLRVK